MGKRFITIISCVVAMLLILAVTPITAGAAESDRYTAHTKDGVDLALKRYRPDACARFRKCGQPIILAPGIMSNFNEFNISTPAGEKYIVQLPSPLAPWAQGDPYIKKDPLKYYNLAHYLWTQGYDVWLFNYRGEGRGPYLSGGAGGYSLDDLGIYDVPAVVEKVYEVTRKHPVWCAHSMGASMAIIYLQGAKYSSGPNSHVVSDPALVAERNGGHGKQSLKGLIDLDGPMGTVGGLALDDPAIWDAIYDPQYLDVRGLTFMLGEFAVQPIIILGQVTWWLFSILGFPNLGMANGLVMINPNNIDAEVLRYLSKYALDGTSTHTFAQLWDAGFHSRFREFYLNGSKDPSDTFPPQPFPGDGYYYYSDNFKKTSLPALVMADDTPDITNPDDVRNFYLGKTRNKLDAFFRVPETAHVDLIMGLNTPTVTFPYIGKWLKALCRTRR